MDSLVRAVDTCIQAKGQMTKTKIEKEKAMAGCHPQLSSPRRQSDPGGRKVPPAGGSTPATWNMRQAAGWGGERRWGVNKVNLPYRDYQQAQREHARGQVHVIKPVASDGATALTARGSGAFPVARGASQEDFVCSSRDWVPPTGGLCLLFNAARFPSCSFASISPSSCFPSSPSCCSQNKSGSSSLSSNGGGSERQALWADQSTKSEVACEHGREILAPGIRGGWPTTGSIGSRLSGTA